MPLPQILKLITGSHPWASRTVLNQHLVTSQSYLFLPQEMLNPLIISKWFFKKSLLFEAWHIIICSICMYSYRREEFTFLGVCSFAHFRFDLVTCWWFVLGRHPISRQTSRHTRLSLQPEQWQIILIMIRVLLKVFVLPKPGDATRAETITERQRITFRKTKVKEENFV